MTKKVTVETWGLFIPYFTPTRSPTSMLAFSLSTACRAAAFAAAAYQTPTTRSRTETIDGSTVSFFESGEDSSLPTEESQCSCFAINDAAYMRFAFIDNVETDTQVEIWAGRADSAGTVVSFRGTEISSPRDVATDIFVKQEQLLCQEVGLPCKLEVGASQVHAGFGRAYGSVRMALLDVLQRLQVLSSSAAAAAGVRPGDAPRLLLTGHSLGGALALLAARELGAALRSGLEIYTFGAPRVGDTALAAEVLRATAQCSGPWRVVNFDDYLVPRFPRGTPANRVWDYVHVGATVLLPPPDATKPCSLLLAAVGDAEGCPLREVNPRYTGFLPPPVFDWPGTNLLAFVAQEARTVLRLLTRGGVSAHFLVAYDAQLTRCRAEGGAPLQTRTVGEEVRVDGSAPDGGYLELLRATYGA